jgi:hypothetical protein
MVLTYQQVQKANQHLESAGLSLQPTRADPLLTPSRLVL